METQYSREDIVNMIRQIFTKMVEKTDKILEADDELKNAEKKRFQFKNSDMKITGDVMVRYEVGKPTEVHFEGVVGDKRTQLYDLMDDPLVDGGIPVATNLYIWNGGNPIVAVFTTFSGKRFDTRMSSDDVDFDQYNEYIDEHNTLKQFEKWSENSVPTMAFFNDDIKYFNNKVSRNAKKLREDLYDERPKRKTDTRRR